MIGSATAVEKITSYGVKCRVFPNPMSNLLFIESNIEISGISLYNLSGIAIIEKTSICDFSVNTDVSGLKPGIYIARIVFSNGEIVTTRLVKR